MSLENWLRNSWISEHETSVQEIANLLAIADRDIEKSQTPNLGPEWSFDIAYNSVLQSGTAALAAAGYRAERANKHKRVLDSLEFTVGLDQTEVAVLDQFRRKRHTAVYEQVGAVSDQEANEMVALAKRVRVGVEAWLRKEHPGLIP